jgi:hypothetical protein
MNNLEAIRERYLRDSLPVRLGGLAANLARIRTFCAHDAGSETVEKLIDESKHFIEWAAPEAEIATTAELAELQVLLARWQLTWTHVWRDPNGRNEVAKQAEFWSRRVLGLSGLLDQ